MKTMVVETPMKKDIDYTILTTKYNKVIFDNYNFNTNIDNLKDVDVGAELLNTMVKDKKHICIVSDSDCDGITSAVVLTKGIKNILKNNNVTTIINSYKDGNGFNNKLVKKICSLHIDKPIDLIITSDHGSNDNEAFKVIKEKCNDVKIILTDHHTIYNYPTVVDVFINPMKEDSTYDKSVSGCVTAFLLIVKAMELKNIKLDKCYELVPYAGISTIVDCMDMNVPYNQFILEMALRIMNSERFTYWRIFKIKLGLGITFTARDFGFNIGPIINCGKVLNNEAFMYDLLMETDLDKLSDKITKAMNYNKLRKTVTKEYTDKITPNIKETAFTICEVIDVKGDYVVNGKVASQIGTFFNLPTIIFTNSKTDVLSGSGRGIIQDYNILETMNKIEKEDSTIFTKYGGHYGALGCSIKKDKFDIFKDLFNRFTQEVLGKDITPLVIDMYVHHKNITPELYEQQEVFGPYGQNKPLPIYVTIMTIDRISDYGPLARLSLSQNGNKLTGNYFFNDVSITKKNIDTFKNKLCFIAFNFEMNKYRGSYSLGINVRKVEVIK